MMMANTYTLAECERRAREARDLLRGALRQAIASKTRTAERAAIKLAEQYRDDQAEWERRAAPLRTQGAADVE